VMQRKHVNMNSIKRI